MESRSRGLKCDEDLPKIMDLVAVRNTQEEGCLAVGDICGLDSREACNVEWSADKKNCARVCGELIWVGQLE